MLRFKCCFVIIDTAKVLWQLCHIVADDFKKYRDFIFFMLSVKKARDTYRLSARIIHSDVYYILVKV